MKIKRRNKKSIKPLAISLVIVFLLLCGYTGYALKTNTWPFPAKSAPAATAEPLTPTQTKTATTTNKTTATNTGDATTTNEVPVSTTLSATITQLEEDNNNNILFSATINGLDTPSTIGTCVVTFTNDNDKPYVQQVNSTVKGGETICGQLSISSLNFSYLGTWKVNLKFYLNNEQTSTDGTIDIH